MGVTVYYRYYTKECGDPKVIPFLDRYNNNNIDFCRDTWEFLEICKKFGEYDRENNCYIFRDYNTLFEFAALPAVPVAMSDYISFGCEYLDPKAKIRHELSDVFIIWIG